MSSSGTAALCALVGSDRTTVSLKSYKIKLPVSSDLGSDLLYPILHNVMMRGRGSTDPRLVCKGVEIQLSICLRSSLLINVLRRPISQTSIVLHPHCTPRVESLQDKGRGWRREEKKINIFIFGCYICQRYT